MKKSKKKKKWTSQITLICILLIYHHFFLFNHPCHSVTTTPYHKSKLIRCSHFGIFLFCLIIMVNEAWSTIFPNYNTCDNFFMFFVFFNFKYIIFMVITNYENSIKLRKLRCIYKKKIKSSTRSS
jgi:amino acid permease